jgi:hypothetical protein
MGKDAKSLASTLFSYLTFCASFNQDGFFFFFDKVSCYGDYDVVSVD